MSLAIDSRQYLELFLNGRGVPAQTLLPPGIFGYDAGYKNPFRQHDIDRARQLLAEAGYRNGIDPATNSRLKLSFDTSATTAAANLQFEYLASAWRQIGLDIEINATTYNQFQDKVRRGAYQIFSWGWIADFPDAGELPLPPGVRERALEERRPEHGQLLQSPSSTGSTTR